MKKYCFFALMAVAMLAVSCSDADPFLGNVKHDNYKTNKKNFDTFTDALLTGCYHQWNKYTKNDDGRWKFEDYSGRLGGGATYCFMIDSKTIIRVIEMGDSTPTNEIRCTKYSIGYNPTDATITTTEILPDGTTGETYLSTLLAGAPNPVIEGSFVGLYCFRGTDNGGFVKMEVRWCFEGCDRAEALKIYEKWLSEQE